MQRCKKICAEVTDVLGSFICVSGWIFGASQCKEPGTEFESSSIKVLVAAANVVLSYDGSVGGDLPSRERLEVLLKRGLANPLGVVTSDIRALYLSYPYQPQPAVWPQRAFGFETSFEIVVQEGGSAETMQSQISSLLNPPGPESKLFKQVLALEGFTVISLETLLLPLVLPSETSITTKKTSAEAPPQEDTPDAPSDNSALITGVVIFLLIAPCLCIVGAYWARTEKMDTE